MEQWVGDIFSGHEQDAKSEHDRLKLLVDISSLSQLTALLRYDPIIERQDLQYAFAIQQRLLKMVPILSAIASRITALGTVERDALKPVLALVHGYFSAAIGLPDDVARRVQNFPSEVGLQHPWHTNQNDLDAHFLRQLRNESAATLPPDFDYALRMAAGIGVSYTLLCGLWLITGWQQGPNAVLIGSMALGFFGGGDEPGKAIAIFGRFAGLALLLAAILCYGMLPLATDFITFIILMGVYTTLGNLGCSQSDGNATACFRRE